MIYGPNIQAALRDRAGNNVWDLVGSGAPTNGTSGTGVNLAGPGSFYVDYTNKIVYLNTNTLASPTWTQIASGAGGANVTLNGTQTLTNKTLGVTNTVSLLDTLFSLKDDGDNTKVLAFQLSGITTGTTRTLTIPNASDTIAVLALAQTLTNKTLTSPVINTPVTLHPVQALAAAGTNQGTGGVITLAGSGIVYVTAADATKGVTLPTGAVGMRITIANDAAANAVLKVYGAAADSATINGTAGSTAYAMAAKVSMDFIFVAAAKWQTLPLLGS